MNYDISRILLAVLVWVTQKLYGSFCVGLKTKTTLNWGKGGRSDLNVFLLRRTQLSHTIKTSIIIIVSSVLFMVEVDTAAIQFASACAKAFCLTHLKET